ncbi:hypothetical protein GC088_14340 [Arthrobacter sp. JZ12]|uniref:hypothetical protein n=1 Tax=Arthrobacter sp. JZ12 TaxID=2654190 RepID=UPI002B4A9D82|nr:hypothetical protein [Arthrobacter sp. JZ12]WRH26130.1 hypothetical protein GC088_14340 [Arthrobacter sp. JZ12]
MSETSPSEISPSPQPTDKPVLTLGVVVPPSLDAESRQEIGEALPRLLSESHPGIGWRLEVETEALDGAAPSELLETARDRLLDEDWDLAVVLSDLALRSGRKPVLTQISPVHKVGLVALPALRAVGRRESITTAVARLVGPLAGWDEDDEPADRARRAREMADDLPDRAEENPVSFTGRVVAGNARVLLGLILANRPWRLAVSLSRALTAAAAAGVVTLATSDLWMLATAYGPWRLVLLTFLAVGAVTLTLMIGADLWERPRRRIEREQVALFNLATTATVVIGVVTFFGALFVLSFLAAVLLVDSGVFAAVVGQPVGLAEYAQLSLLTAALATVGGALGAGLENDDVVRAAAFTRNDV